MPPDPPRGQGPPGLADWGSRGGDSKSPDSPRAGVKVECNTVGMLHPPLCPGGGGAVVYIDWCINNMDYKMHDKNPVAGFTVHISGQ